MEVGGWCGVGAWGCIKKRGGAKRLTSKARRHTFCTAHQCCPDVLLPPPAAHPCPADHHVGPPDLNRLPEDVGACSGEVQWWGCNGPCNAALHACNRRSPSAARQPWATAAATCTPLVRLPRHPPPPTHPPAGRYTTPPSRRSQAAATARCSALVSSVRPSPLAPNWVFTLKVAALYGGCLPAVQGRMRKRSACLPEGLPACQAARLAAAWLPPCLPAPLLACACVVQRCTAARPPPLPSAAAKLTSVAGTAPVVPPSSGEVQGGDALLRLCGGARQHTWR